MRPLLASLLIGTSGLALSCAPAGGQAKTITAAPKSKPPAIHAPDTPAEWQATPATPLTGQPGEPHNGTTALKPLRVIFDSPAWGDRRDLAPDETVALEIALCNTGETPLEGVQVRVIFGSHAQTTDGAFRDFTPLSAGLLPAGPECADTGKAFRLALTVQSTGKLKAGQRVSVSPIVVVRWREAVETYECPVKLVFAAPQAPAPEA